MAHSSISIHLPEVPILNPDEHSTDIEDVVPVDSTLDG
jgi:hypothetical protein